MSSTTMKEKENFVELIIESPVIARSISEVINKLEAIIHQSELANERIGYFASLYHKVTVKVKEGIDEGQFGNAESLEELDVLFANRFLHAFEEWQNGKTVPGSWNVAFRASGQRSRLVLQHLLLGINAHINYDLGIAAVETARLRNIDISVLRKDFNTINTILAALTYDVISKLNIVSPLLSILGFTGTKSNSMLIQFSIGNARDGAWCFAEDLSAVSNEIQYHQLVTERDKSIEALGKSIVTSKGFLRFGTWIIHLFEWKKVKEIIHILHEHKQLYKHELK
jgi:hypothetical protein